MDLSSIASFASLFGGAGGNAASGGVTPGLSVLAGSDASPFPVTPNPGMGPLATPGGQGGGTILGMSPAQFASVFGQMANAIGGGKTLGARMGQIAAQMGMAQMQGLLAKNQQSAYNKSMQEILSAIPEKKLGTLSQVNTLLGAAGNGGAPSAASLLQGTDLGNIIQDIK